MTYQTPRGTRDFLPEEMIRRQYVLDKIRKVFELWGFDPLETPAFEEWKLLSAKSSGGEEIKEEIYYFRDKAERELGLRFDLTVPLARVVASNPNLPKPFKRYQIDPVWRYDRPGSGRWREFWQADVDILGSAEPEADAEIIAIACNCLNELGFNSFVVRVNSRKLIEELILEIGIEQENTVEVFRIIDKLDKIGEQVVKEELIQKGFESTQINKILKILATSVDEIKTDSDKALTAIDELKKIASVVSDLGYEKNIKIDLSLVRGLEYYTGPVFEIVIEGTKLEKLSVSGGGRYDNLIKLYGGKPTPAVGISLGVERLVETMKELDMFAITKTLSKIFIISIGDSVKIRRQVIRISNTLRESGISCEFDLMKRSLSKQLDYANAKGIPYVLFVGDKELDKNVVKLKDMKSGAETEINITNIDEEVLRIIK